MAWEISWVGDTRERLLKLAREHLAKFAIEQDIGLLAVKRVEEEIRLHPIPAADLPQIRIEEVFDFAGMQVRYYIDSEKGEAEIMSVSVAF